MITDTITHAARIGYSCYYGTRRAGASWEAAPFPVRARWELCAALVLNGNVTTARGLRDEYLWGYDAVSWAGDRSAMGQRWRRVLQAMQAVGLQVAV